MVKSLKTLIKLAAKDVENEQQIMGRLQAKLDELNEKKTAFEQAILKESELAQKKPEYSADFGNFANSVQDKIRNLAEQIHLQEQKIATQRDVLRAAFAEQKKYEIALENKEEMISQEEKRKEQIMLDELAGQGHRRKNS